MNNKSKKDSSKSKDVCKNNCDDDCDEECEEDEEEDCEDDNEESDSEEQESDDDEINEEDEEEEEEPEVASKKDKKVKDEKEEDDEEVEINNYDMFFDDLLCDGIYPSFILFAQMNKELSDTPLIHFYIEDKKAHVKAIVEPNDFMEQCISEHDMTDKDEEIFSPWIKWKRDALLNADKPGFINFSCVLEVNGKVKNRVNKTITYRPVNEAFIGFYDKKGEFTDFSALFSCFVNEDHPLIDKILNEIIESDKKERKITFYGYQGDSDKEVLKQMEWIWNYFAKKGTRYSDITGSSNSSESIVAQYVRFFEQVIGNNQANCIDGTCMLASIYKKIGLDVSIVLVPGHAFLAVSGKDRDEDGNAINTYYLETTLMGEKNMTFLTALDRAEEEYEDIDSKKDLFEININGCRAAGIMPLGR